MPDTQKKIEEFVEEDWNLATNIPDYLESAYKATVRRAIAYGLRLSCEMGPEKVPEEHLPGGGCLTYDNGSCYCFEQNIGYNSALTERDEAVREMAARVEKG